jgi:uncharacterized protein YfaA (DUF2138 family)
MNRFTRIRITASLAAMTVLAAGCTMSVQSGAQSDPDETGVAALPKEVRDALDRAAQTYLFPLSDAKWSQVHSLAGSRHPIYQLRGTNGRGNTIELEVTKAGRIIEVEEHGIAIDEVPSVVVEALKAKRPAFKPSVVEAIYQGQNPQPACYGFEGTDGAGNPIEVYITADGRTFLN